MHFMTEKKTYIMLAKKKLPSSDPRQKGVKIFIEEAHLILREKAHLTFVDFAAGRNAANRRKHLAARTQMASPQLSQGTAT